MLHGGYCKLGAYLQMHVSSTSAFIILCLVVQAYNYFWTDVLRLLTMHPQITFTESRSLAEKYDTNIIVAAAILGLL